jgi:hypothetical protein
MSSSPTDRSDATGSEPTKDEAPRNDTPFSTRPLGRVGTRLFLLLAFTLVIGGAYGLASFVVDAARETDSPPASPDTTQQAAPADTTRGSQ